MTGSVAVSLDEPLPLAERDSDIAPVDLGADELGDALSHLPDRQRLALTLRYYADWPEADIAAALGVRAGTVRTLVMRGLARLRQELEP